MELMANNVMKRIRQTTRNPHREHTCTAYGISKAAQYPLALLTALERNQTRNELLDIGRRVVK